VQYSSPPVVEPTGPVRVETRGAALLGPRDATRRSAVQDDVPARLVAGDATLWGADAEEESRIRLGWLRAHEVSRELLPRLAALRAELQAEGIDRVVLCGMGGSSLAPEVISRTQGVELTVVDTTDPHQVAAAIADRLDRTIVVVSSKSGGTVETDSHQRVFAQAFRDSGLSEADVGRRFVAVTDPDSPLAESAAAQGFRAVFLADPNVGGRYSALTAFGLVPTALAGADVDSLLADAAAAFADLDKPTGNPGLDLGAALGGNAASGRDKAVLAEAGGGLPGFGDWAEQLIAESTGKLSRGILPVVVSDAEAPGTAFAATGDTHLLRLGEPAANSTSVTGPLGAQFLVWEYATAVAGRTLGINPFDQPNVAESKDNTRKLLDEAGDGPLDEGEPLFTEGPVVVYADAGLFAETTDLSSVLAALLDAIPPTGYLAVMAYLDRFAEAEAEAAGVRDLLAARTGRSVTFGWGPRFLHSTGQYHKGGPQVGAYLQVTGEVTRDLDIPDRPFTLGRLQRAQALGDLRALTNRGRPIVRLHLTDRAAGVAVLLTAAREPDAS
jgi:glucose-6-phosphate isomerase